MYGRGGGGEEIGKIWGTGEGTAMQVIGQFPYDVSISQLRLLLQKKKTSQKAMSWLVLR